MIKVEDDSFISELGQRFNNEDKCGYVSGNIYIVCDGVGGLNKGEVASEIVCNSVLNYFVDNENGQIKDAIHLAESNLKDHIEINENSQGMATTLALAKIRENSIYLAWVGDSRIYQFRNGRAQFITKDHSWVNDALDSGLITIEESINHPKSNIITRAVQGSHKPVEADFVLLEDIRINDYFLICSDGILESWKKDELEELFSENHPTHIILEKIKLQCEKKSKDNFTAIIFKIKESNHVSALNDETVNAMPINKFEWMASSFISYKQRVKKLFQSTFI